jgi:hypothetical protein
MDEISNLPMQNGALPTGQGHRPISGTYMGQRGAYRLELRIDLNEGLQSPYQPLTMVSGDLFREVGGEEWDHQYSFLVEQPTVVRVVEEVTIRGAVVQYQSLELPSTAGSFVGQADLKVTVPLCQVGESPLPATVHLIRSGVPNLTFLCQKMSDFFRTIELEIDCITGTECPQPFQTRAVAGCPADLPSLELDIGRAYQRAGIDIRITSESEVFAPAEAGVDLKWDEDELHHAMEHHFSLWRDEPQWKLYLLVATHYQLYPTQVVTGIMYDSDYRDASDHCPRQGAAVFYASMAAAWGSLSPAEFERNYLRACVHELGHALNLLHSFDKDRPESPSWMNYPWRYPYGYNVPPGWDGSLEFWRNCRFEFDAEEVRHLRHDALLEVIPGGAAFGVLGHDETAPRAVTVQQQEAAPVALYVRTRPERNLFRLAEPVTIELKLKNQSKASLIAPAMLNPAFGLLKLYIRDPRGEVRPYEPLFKLCSEARMVELPPGEKLYESAFVTYGAKGFYFEEPGEYQIWAVYGAGGLRLRSNLLRLRVAFPQSSADEEMALWTFGRDQGHVLYMRGAEYLQAGNDRLHEVIERFPDSNLSRYIHFCFGNSRARAFKDLVAGRVRSSQPEFAAKELEQARKFSPVYEKYSALDNITHGRAADLLANLYLQMDEPQKARSTLIETARYFKRIDVKPEVIEEMRRRAEAIEVR